MRKLFSCGFFIFFMFIVCSNSVAQGAIRTAADFFASVSQQYGSIHDFEVNLDIKTGKQTMKGQVSFKRPDLLRIDFSSPENQVIVFNGDDLIIYLPGSQAILNQSSVGGGGGANLATPQGLSLMARCYTVAYEIGQEAQPLEEGSTEEVIKLILHRRNTAEAFRYIKLAINPNTLLIRRVEAVTPQAQSFIFDFSGYRLNVGIPDQRFIYDAPASANNYNNFLFSE